MVEGSSKSPNSSCLEAKVALDLALGVLKESYEEDLLLGNTALLSYEITSLIRYVENYMRVVDRGVPLTDSSQSNDVPKRHPFMDRFSEN
jgi:hypothetical protein